MSHKIATSGIKIETDYNIFIPFYKQIIFLKYNLSQKYPDATMFLIIGLYRELIEIFHSLIDLLELIKRWTANKKLVALTLQKYSNALRKWYLLVLVMPLRMKVKW